MIVKAVIEKKTSDGIEVLLGGEEAKITIQQNEFKNISKYKVGDWLDVFIEKGKIKSVRLNQEETIKVKNRVKKKIDLLRLRNKE